MRVFVYGSLMSGGVNARRMDGATPLGPIRTAPLYSLHAGRFPSLVRDGETSVRGELYGVTAPHLARLDHFEGHPDLYHRGNVTLEDGTIAAAWLRYGASVRGQPLVVDGDWRAHRAAARLPV